MLSFFHSVDLTMNRWWWHSARGQVYPPPDVVRLITWFAPRATGRWRAFFLITEAGEPNPSHTPHGNLSFPPKAVGNE